MAQGENPQRVCLNGQWLFRADPNDVGEKEAWYVQTADPADWRSIVVPVQWEAKGHEGYDGAAWYRRTFELPDDDFSSWGMCIGGVDHTCKAWLNGVPVASHDHPDRRFAFNIGAAARPGTNTVCIRVWDDGGPGGLLRAVRLGKYSGIGELLRGEHFGTKARVSADWVRDAVIYEVYLRSFSPGGDFKGLEKRLGELKQMGVTVIWLMPIHPVGEKKRKGALGSPYSVRDYYAVNPEFGSMEDFRSLLSAAHDHGLKIIIDFVANHTAWDCELIREHPDWYVHDDAGEIRSPVPEWSDVADLDYARPEVRQYMKEVMLYWVRDVGIDGFRCDVAGMLPSDFWREVRRELDRIKLVMMIAEDDEPQQHLEAFDVTYDWATYYSLEELGSGDVRAKDMAVILRDEGLDFPRDSLRMRFSSNHDTCAWRKAAVSRYGVAGARAAAVLSFALPGVPLIYNGQEAGNKVNLKLFERVLVDWSRDDERMRELYTSLARLRRERVSFRRGTAQVLNVKAGPHVLALSRRCEQDETVVLINFANAPQQLVLDEAITDSLKPLFGTAVVEQTEDGRLLRLPALGYWIAAGDR
ncbi:MAG: alpha-galactosidase [Phycisphaerales bacterium]|nr:MAG: alpha-galactosidase [Phycisphaerales bacterium]